MRRMMFGRYSVLALGLLIASCGGGDSGGNPNGPTPPQQPPPANPGTAPISIVGERGQQSFNPNPATAGQGSTVTWRNTDTQVHRIVSNDGTLDTGDIAPGATSPARTLATNGANYHCSLHPTTMIGAISGVAGAPPPPCTGEYC